MTEPQNEQVQSRIPKHDLIALGLSQKINGRRSLLPDDDPMRDVLERVGKCLTLFFSEVPDDAA